jgi:multiple sugar transport system substrate-binding protein
VEAGGGRATPNHPQVVRALEWMARWAQRYGTEAVSRSFAGVSGHQMASERLGMAPMTAGDVRKLGQTNPELKLGFGLLPYAAPGKPNPTWIAGWDHALLAGSKARDLGWRFMHWVAYTPEGTQAVFKHAGGIPGWRPSPALKEVQGDPLFKAFYEVLTTARLARINIPVAARLYDFLAEQGDAAIAGKVTARQALDTVAQLTQAEWAQFNTQNGLK